MDVQWPTQEYAKLFPADVLLDGNGLDALQFGGWARIWLQLWRLNPPGLLLPLDLPLLQDWASMRDKEWRGNQAAVLRGCKFHPATCSLHQVKQQALYLDWARSTLRMRAGGRASAKKRMGQKQMRIGEPETKLDLGTTPYSPFREPFWEIRAETWAKIEEIANKTAENRRCLEGALKVLPSTLSTTTSYHQVTGVVPPPAPEAGGAGAATDAEVWAFIARLRDAELQRLQTAALDALATKNPFMRNYRDANPRQSITLATVLFNHHAQHGDPPAVPGDGTAAAG